MTQRMFDCCCDTRELASDRGLENVASMSSQQARSSSERACVTVTSFGWHSKRHVTRSRASQAGNEERDNRDIL